MNGKEAETLEYIKSYINRRGYAPAYREIGKAVSINSTSQIRQLLISLEKQGQIRRKPGVTRSIVIREKNEPT